jgi:hypothetical protein
MKPGQIDARGGVPVGLIGALALIVGVESFIASHKSDTMDGSLWAYEHARRIAAEKARDCGLLAFGDSLMRHGVAPKVIRERTGLEGYNLSIPGSQVPASYFLFREAIESGARPRVVLLDLFPCLLTSDPWANITNWPILASYRDCVDMGWHARDPKLFVSLMLRKTLPSVRCRESIRVAILEALDGRGGDTRTNIQVGLWNWEVNRGLAIEKYRLDPTIPLENPLNQFFRPIRCTPLNRLYIDRFMKLAAKHDVKVFLVLPPYMPNLQARVEQAGFDADHEAFVRSMLDRYPELGALDARKSKYAADAFIDTHHLGYEGASTFSVDIGDLLRRQLDRGGSAARWVAMPAFSKKAITVKHEDGYESRLAFLKEVEKRR